MSKLIASILTAAIAATAATADPILIHDGTFPRVDPSYMTATGQSVIADCQGPASANGDSPYGWPDATATLRIMQSPTSSVVSVTIRDARPNTYYSMWLRLRGQDADGVEFGGSPLTGIPGTALVPSDAIQEAVNALTTPVPYGLNGFWSDDRGDGSIIIPLDFPIAGGAYPFHRWTMFDANALVPSADDPRPIPVAIVGEGTGAPFTLRLASHCVDGLSHGLIAGPHEAWFDWLMPSGTLLD